MKKLQSNFTTPEQSKRLLELGVPADSADCFYYSDNQGEEEFPSIIPIVNDGEICFSLFCDNKAVPCWSVGRLMDIIRTCNLTAEKPWVYIEQDNIHAMITAITDGVNNNMLDFSKLEE